MAGDYAGRFALLEEAKGLPFGTVWDYYCWRREVPVGVAFVDDIRDDEQRELSRRG